MPPKAPKFPILIQLLRTPNPVAWEVCEAQNSKQRLTQLEEDVGVAWFTASPRI